jgi:hypothetical protein
MIASIFFIWFSPAALAGGLLLRCLLRCVRRPRERAFDVKHFIQAFAVPTKAARRQAALPAD